ncbi:hypothetical protein [Salidesulfovibrio brasiliensis]|uniref:hypothetical protein n=1 Tax=Salidesulfovibrio brasiliensis TaxID=221711 RepID=UPI000B0C5CBC|nr:hypothetical protein [Salidesulfovibrio brasiliensis]
MINALSVDVEDYYHVSAFENVIDRADWDHYPSRVADNTRRVLDLFDMHEVTGTFFCARLGGGTGAAAGARYRGPGA